MQDQPPPDKKMKKTFVKTNDTAAIQCPECELVKHISVSTFRNSKHTFKIKCTCGHIFPVTLDFRRHYRKPTDLTGIYEVVVPPNHGGGKMQINNISRSGIDFTVSGLHKIQEGMQIVVSFRLDNKKETEINKNVVARRVRDNKIGCEFTEQMQIGKDLGFYLRP